MQWTAFLRRSHLSSAPARVVSNLYLPISVETPLALQENIKQQRPILFLTSETQNLPSFSKSIIERLKKSGEPWEIYEVPRHRTKLTQFIG